MSKLTDKIINKVKQVQANSAESLKNDVDLYYMNIEDNDQDAGSYYMMGTALEKLAQQIKDESFLNDALECLNEAIKLTDNKNPLYLVDRSKLHVEMGHNDLAVADITSVNKLSKEGIKIEGIAGIYIKNTVHDIAKLDIIQTQVAILLQDGKIDSELASVLREHANVTQSLVVQVGVHSEKLEKHDERIEQLEEQFKKEKALVTVKIENFAAMVKQLEDGKQVSDQDIAALQRDTDEMKALTIKHTGQIANIEQQLPIIYSELSMKLDDNAKKLKQELDSLTLSPEDKTKIEGYYKAFVGTIEASYVTAQAVDSGKLEISKSLLLSIMSGLVSLTPAIGEAASKGVEIASIPLNAILSGICTTAGKAIDEAGNAAVGKSTQEKARQIKKLAENLNSVSQQVSKAAIKIVLDKDKQNQIINISIEDLNELPKQCFEKVKKVFTQLKVEIDEKLYGKMYPTTAERLGNEDANALLEKYLKNPEIEFSSFVKDVMKSCGFYVVSIDELRSEVSQGTCTDKLKELFTEGYLKPKLQKSLKPIEISNKEISKAQMITFNLLCKVAQEAQDQVKAMACVKDFAKKHQDLVNQIANEHPEYFCTLEIANAAITNATPNAQEQKELLTLAFNQLINNIEDIETAIRDSIKELDNTVSNNGTWTNVKKLFTTDYLKSKMNPGYSLKISDEAIAKAKMVMFKHMCKAIEKDPNNTTAMACVAGFANEKKSKPWVGKKHKDLLVQIANEHPEYFCTLEIAQTAITEAISGSQKQEELLTVVFNKLIKNIDNIEIALRGSTDKLNSTLSSNGTWADVKKLFNEESLQKVLKKDYPHGNVSDEEIIKAQKVMFKHMCKATTQDNVSCVQSFVQEYPDLLLKIAAEHIVREAIIDPGLQNTVLGKINPTGKGHDEHQKNSYWDDYWYEYSQKAMEQILKLRLESAGIENAKIVSTNYVFDESSKFDFVSNLLTKIPAEFGASSSSSNDNNITKLLIPINLCNKHWVGLVIERSLDQITAYYMDSEKSKPMPKALRSSFEGELAKLYPNSHIEITEQQLREQKYNNCGLEVIENLIAMCGVSRISEDEALAAHSLLLEASVLKQEITDTASRTVDGQQLSDDNAIYSTETSKQHLLLGEEGMYLGL